MVDVKKRIINSDGSRSTVVVSVPRDEIERAAARTAAENQRATNRDLALADIPDSAGLQDVISKLNAMAQYLRKAC